MTSPDDIAGALTVAIARRSEAHADCPLFNDPYAEVFIDAAKARGCTIPDGEPTDRIQGFANYTSSRTKYFDEFFIAAGAHGIEQVVIVAAGLDARAWRLPWISNTTIFEIDHPPVLRFKADALAARGDTPSVHRYVPVPADLTDAWDTALRDAGFDAAEPTAWAIEGLLPHVEDGPHLLFDRIHELSAPTSRFAVEAVGMGVTRWLAERGWQAKTTTAQELMTRHGRCGAHDAVDTVPDTVFVEAKRER
ncbi:MULTISPECIES: SAM-dependent methyltransferase [Mycobacteriaceae]|uniref:SAM-dependent methyltransferase n=1 Tax=Mycobacteriaceae TaxID=1762 RepID=UPI0007FCD3ED|nr:MULTISPECIES: SAM-dependent methyltransferase [Mycobacteriaceae]MCK0175657.1 SAM-dependent methyltransferase [Mycolicibacterium sp. F2034L]OBB58653.1 SAM-dependent methyltransferase [Mycobacterium sp. 852013-51886_SCH5428379]